MEPPSTVRVEIVSRFRSPGLALKIRAAIQNVIPKEGLVCVLLCDDKEIQSLNSHFRGIDEPTDVLTFPSDGFPGSPIGEIAISLPYAQRQAIERKVSTEIEVSYLAIHGALHLLGYDDETEDDRKAMWGATLKAAEQLGLPPDKEWTSVLQGAAT